MTMHRLIATALLITTSACSILTVRGPTAEQSPPRCTRDWRWPMIVDVGLVVVGVAIAGVAEDAYQNNGHKTIDAAGIGAGIGVSALAVASTFVGYRRADRCQQAWDAYDASERPMWSP